MLDWQTLGAERAKRWVEQKNRRDTLTTLYRVARDASQTPYAMILRRVINYTENGGWHNVGYEHHSSVAALLGEYES